jgi:hypothetical protein
MLPVDLYKAIAELIREKKRLDRRIDALEVTLVNGRTVKNRSSSGRVARRPGRKSMGAEERRQVSERMTRYWAARRASDAALDEHGHEGTETS